MKLIFSLFVLSLFSISFGCICLNTTPQEAYQNVDIVAKIKAYGVKKGGKTNYQITYQSAYSLIDALAVDQPTNLKPITSCSNEVQNNHEYLMGITCVNGSIIYEQCGHVIRDFYGSKIKIEPFEWTDPPKDLIDQLLKESTCDFLYLFIK